MSGWLCYSMNSGVLHEQGQFVTRHSQKSTKSVKADSPQENSVSVVDPTGQNNARAKQLAKSSDPAFTKFTTYIRKATHLGVKTRLVSKEKELSDLVEELLSNWLRSEERRVGRKSSTR